VGAGQHTARRRRSRTRRLGARAAARRRLARLHSLRTAGLVILDIGDVAHPKLVGQLPFTPPFLGFIGAHSALPLPSRKIAVVNSEAIREDCRSRSITRRWSNIADPAKPTLLSMFPLPVPPAGSPHKNFCEKGGRFGPHNLNQLYHNPFVERSASSCTSPTSTRALRIVDISDARQPREVGYFIRPTRPSATGRCQQNWSRRPRTCSWMHAGISMSRRRIRGYGF